MVFVRASRHDLSNHTVPPMSHRVSKHVPLFFIQPLLRRNGLLVAKKVYLPKIVNGSGSNGNWELSMIEAITAIGVFLDDKTTFDKGIAMWRKRVPAYIYLKFHGVLPVPPPTGNRDSQDKLIAFWYDQTNLVDGLAQETCRDFGHTQLGFSRCEPYSCRSRSDMSLSLCPRVWRSTSEPTHHEPLA